MAAEKRGDWTMPPYVPRDLGWDVLTVFASSSHMPPPLINKAFETVVNSFHANIQRVKLMILAPVFSSDLAVRLQRYRDIAEFELTGKIIDAPSKDHPRREEILHFRNDRISADAWEAEQALRANANTAWEKLTASLIQRSNPAIATLARYPSGAGLEALISSAVTGTWTAFETMAGDLWEVALNHHPDRLSEMKGKRRRLMRSDDDDEAIEIPRTIPMQQLQRHGFDLRDKMGTALRGLQKLDSLSGIREAYAMAFSKKSDAVDAALKREALDWLSTVRNLIVHRAGIADQTYQQKCKYLTSIPKAELGHPILLDGPYLSGLMLAAIVTSHELLKAVDDWIREN